MNLIKLIFCILIITLNNNVKAEINNLYIYSSIDNLMFSVKDYFKDCKEYPSEERGLQELIYSNKRCWNGPYIKSIKIINKRCDHEYKYLRTTMNNFVIVDSGKDCIYGNNDDLKTTDSSATKQIRVSEYKQVADHNKFFKKIIVLFLILLILSLLRIIYRKLNSKKLFNYMIALSNCPKLATMGY